MLKNCIWFAVLLSFLGSHVACAEVIWLSETPPSKRALATPAAAQSEPAMEHDHTQHQAMPQDVSAVLATSAVAVSGAKKHSHGGGAEVDVDGEVVADNTHSGKKQVWLRSGDDPRGAKYLSGVQGALTLFSQAGGMPSVALTEDKGLSTAKLDLPDLGFYNAYWMQKMDHRGMLHMQIAKAELLHGTCCAKDVDEAEVAKPITNPAIPLELVREHYPDEGLFTRIVSGDKVNFTVFGFGVPVAGAKVTMISHQGWQSTQTSDNEGRVTFTMIRDYYPNWLQFKKRFKQSYLMTADLNLPDAVTVDGVTYSSAYYNSTLAGSYYPSPYDYRSYAWGLGIALFVIVFGGLAVYLYRRRRLKPYQEVRVDDKS